MAVLGAECRRRCWCCELAAHVVETGCRAPALGAGSVRGGDSGHQCGWALVRGELAGAGCWCWAVLGAGAGGGDRVPGARCWCPLLQ